VIAFWEISYKVTKNQRSMQGVGSKDFAGKTEIAGETVWSDVEGSTTLANQCILEGVSLFRKPNIFGDLG